MAYVANMVAQPLFQNRVIECHALVEGLWDIKGIIQDGELFDGYSLGTHSGLGGECRLLVPSDCEELKREIL